MKWKASRTGSSVSTPLLKFYILLFLLPHHECFLGHQRFFYNIVFNDCIVFCLYAINYLVSCLLLDIKNISLAKMKVKFIRPFLTTAFFFAWLVGSQLPNEGLNSGTLQWKRRVLSTGPPENNHNRLLFGPWYSTKLNFFKKHFPGIREHCCMVLKLSGGSG